MSEPSTTVRPQDVVERALEPLRRADGVHRHRRRVEQRQPALGEQHAHHQRRHPRAAADRHRHHRRPGRHGGRRRLAQQRRPRPDRGPRPRGRGRGTRGTQRRGRGAVHRALRGRPDWADEPAVTSIDVFSSVAPALGTAFASARAQGRDLFGFAEHQVSTTYLGSSTGLRIRHDQPTGRLELNGKQSTDWSRSSWVGQSTRDFGDVDIAALDAQAGRRLGWADRRVELPAGRYETLLPPSAVADLMIYLYWSSVARDAHDGRTVFSQPGGGTRVGERLADLPVRMWSDPRPGVSVHAVRDRAASGGAQSVFDNGLPIATTDWIRDGELRALIQTRHTAALTGLPVTPPSRQPDPRVPTARPAAGRDGRRHGPRPAAHLPLVHPRGRPADAAAHRPDPRRRLPGRGRRGRRRGQQLPLQREPGRPARAAGRGRPHRAHAAPRVRRLLHPHRHAGAGASATSTCPRSARRHRSRGRGCLAPGRRRPGSVGALVARSGMGVHHAAGACHLALGRGPHALLSRFAGLSRGQPGAPHRGEQRPGPAAAYGKAGKRLKATVPVFVHVVTDGAIGALTDPQIAAQVGVLNDVRRRRGRCRDRLLIQKSRA